MQCDDNHCSVLTVSAAVSRDWLRMLGSEDYLRLTIHKKFGEWSFGSSRPAVWNSLPSDLHNVTDTGTFTLEIGGRRYWYRSCLQNHDQQKVVLSYPSLQTFFLFWQLLTLFCKVLLRVLQHRRSIHQTQPKKHKSSWSWILAIDAARLPAMTHYSVTTHLLFSTQLKFI